MKKILLVATVQSHICQFHKPLIAMLRETRDVEIHVAARNNLAEKNGMKLDFADKVFDVPFERSPFSSRNLKAYRQLKQIIVSEKYDVIHCNTPVGGILSRMAARPARKKGTKVIYTAHGFHFYRGASLKNWLMYYPIEKVFSCMTDILITINEEDYRLAKKHFSCNVVRIHGTGVDTGRYNCNRSEGRQVLPQAARAADHRILCIGELLPNKNQAMAIRAMQDIIKVFPHAVLLLAGNGPEQENLEKQIAQSHLENNVIMLGYCTNLECYQKQCDLLVSCSRREGLGLNIIEAMLCGNPVVATKNRGHNELISHGETGYLVEQNDASAMAEYVTAILSDPASAEAMGRKGSSFACGYSADVVKKELKEIYGSVLRD